jgi:hypothetical protein
MDGKQEFLSRIENAKGIVLVIAHADGATVRLPGMGGGLTITPADIAQLHLKNSPFVVLRICNAVDRGYADAFGRAGATGVWANRGIITAETANRQIAAFFEELAAGQSILESIQKIQARDGAAKASVGLFTALKPLAPSQEAPSGESRHGHRETS